MSAPADSNEQRLLVLMVFAVFESAMTSEISVASTTRKSGREEDGDCVRDKCILSFTSRSCRDMSDNVFAASLNSNDHISWLSGHREWCLEDCTSARVVLTICCMLGYFWCAADANANSNVYIIITTATPAIHM